ncbi:hypothetical protein COL922a_012700 [Colletotrichum nupharicola]|nr:hypothetical protein COL922a_012700 [Colletotrichum nupharicola]
MPKSPWFLLRSQREEAAKSSFRKLYPRNEKGAEAALESIRSAISEENEMARLQEGANYSDAAGHFSRGKRDDNGEKFDPRLQRGGLEEDLKVYWKKEAEPAEDDAVQEGNAVAQSTRHVAVDPKRHSRVTGELSLVYTK